MMSATENNKNQEVQIKKVSSSEVNVSDREVTYDIYVNGEYRLTYSDIIDALDYAKAIHNK
jgi:FlaG/FlaF family flagellin (archaellin)